MFEAGHVCESCTLGTGFVVVTFGVGVGLVVVVGVGVGVTPSTLIVWMYSLLIAVLEVVSIAVSLI